MYIYIYIYTYIYTYTYAYPHINIYNIYIYVAHQSSLIPAPLPALTIGNAPSNYIEIYIDI